MMRKNIIRLDCVPSFSSSICASWLQSLDFLPGSSCKMRCWAGRWLVAEPWSLAGPPGPSGRCLRSPEWSAACERQCCPTCAYGHSQRPAGQRKFAADGRCVVKSQGSCDQNSRDTHRLVDRGRRDRVQALKCLWRFSLLK